MPDVSWQEETKSITKLPNGMWLARGCRIPDGVDFAEMQADSVSAQVALDRWLDAPLKSPDQTLKDYMKSEAYTQFIWDLENLDPTRIGEQNNVTR
jgi:hypothetical protein